jgi:hypothetical protein
MGRTRLLVFENLGASIPLPFLVVLVFWTTRKQYGPLLRSAGRISPNTIRQKGRR